MSGNKHSGYWALALAISLLAACQTATIPVAYDTRADEIAENPYGCWSNFVINADADTLSGELICLENDTLYLLIADFHIAAIQFPAIDSYQIYTHKNQSAKYGGLTALFMAPSLVGMLIHMVEYDGGFLALGIPMALVGITHMLVEGNSTKNIVTETSSPGLQELNLYARYPGGKPFGADLRQLTLKR